MRRLILTVFLAFLGMVMVANAATINVTFQVDMSIQIAKGNFKVGTDTLVVRGSFQKEAGDTAGDWQGMKFVLTDPNSDKIYTATISLPADSANKKYEFKFVINSGGWESVSNRSFILTAPGPQLLPVAFFNNEKPAAKTYTIKFTADLTDIYGSGAGYFDASTDSILVMGLDWEGGTNVQGSRKMSETLTPGIYVTTLKVQATGDSTKWKFRAFPENHFTNTGWEVGDDRWFKYGNDTVLTFPTIKPRIFPAQPALTADVKVLFQVNMKNAKNQYDKS
ncbi:MAG: hypothetical protein ACM3S2_08755, partial [Ignavibacteriales bacterium]